MVPGMVVGVGDFGPDDFDDAGAGFDQPAGQQATLAECVAAIAVAHLFRFLGEVERFAGAAGNNQVQRALVIIVEIVVLDGLVDFGHGLLDGVAQLGAALEPQGEHLRRQLEIVDPDMVHLVHVHVVALGIERVGIESLAEETGAAAFADDVGFLERTREHDERQHRLGHRPQADDVASRSSGNPSGRAARAGRTG